jgi:hypothetical protein
MTRMIRNIAFVLLAVVGVLGDTTVKADEACPYNNNTYYDGYNINGGQCEGTDSTCTAFCNAQPNGGGGYCSPGYLQCGPWSNCGFCQCSGCVI